MTNTSFLIRMAGCLFYALLPFLAFGQADTVPPQLVCKNALDINMPLCGQYGFILQPSDLLESYSDNASPVAQLVLKARRTCAGTGFPEDPPPSQLQPLFFAYYDLYHSFPLEIWARDEVGNTAMCTTSVSFYDGFATCDPGMSFWTNFAGDDSGISDVQIDLTGTRCPGDTLQFEVTTFGGMWYGFGLTLPSGYQSSITPAKNTHPLNGITMHDLFLISQHILGIARLTNPYQLIAADANQDGQITDDDRLLLRRLMKGVITQLPNGRSWRFMPYDFVFDPLQPLVFPEQIEVSATEYPSQYYRFRGVKIGDVDFSADPAQ
ncbi:MAG: dockerin type I domain-containing protein [Saprospiraceae bacterium]